MAPPPWPYPHVAAHRGGGILAPENTLAAIRAGWGRGFRAVEFDAMLSGDGEPILIHDETLNRTAGVRGRVADWTYADLARLDAGCWYSKEFAGERIPHLDEAVQWCRAHGIWMNVEIKPSAGAERRTGERVARDLARHFPQSGGADRMLPLLSSFSEQALQAAREAAPWLPRGLLRQKIGADWLQALAALQCVSLHADHRHLQQRDVAAVRDSGHWLFAYTVNERNRALRLFEWGIDAICTDRLDRVPPDLFERRSD